MHADVGVGVVRLGHAHAQRQVAELGAPVAQIVDAVHAVLVRRAPQNVGGKVADDGGAQVADVERLRDVGRTELDENRLRARQRM